METGQAVAGQFKSALGNILASSLTAAAICAVHRQMVMAQFVITDAENPNCILVRSSPTSG